MQRKRTPCTDTTRFLIIPGWGGSGPDHWQSHWEREIPHSSRVEMPDWHTPRRAEWVRTLDRVVRSMEEPPILIAHSLGCIAVAHWAALSTLRIRGALLVAPADLDREACPLALRDFAPVPRGRIRFPSHVVASDDDPYASLARVKQIARDWGSDLTILHRAGHINSESGYGRWPEARALVDDLEGETRESEPRSLPFAGYELEGDDPLWICRGVD